MKHFCALPVLLLVTSVAFAQSPTVSTDWEDYGPGETVVVTGTGWLPGEMVELVFLEDPLIHPAETLYAVADDDGNIYNDEYVIQDHDIDQNFTLTATGLTSGWVAQTYFRDSAHSNPVPQAIPYSQNFSALAHASTTYPAGWQGWRLASSGSSSFRTNDATANHGLQALSTAVNLLGGVHNYNGKIGFLATTLAGTDPSVVLALNLTGKSDVKIKFDVMTIRNPFGLTVLGITSNRINHVDVQYRVGTTDTFKTLTNSPNGLYTNNTTQQIGLVTTPQNDSTRTLSLPAAVNNQPVVHIRWVQRDGTGANLRPSFAIDNVNVCELAVSTHPSDQTVCAGSTASFTASATGDPSPSLQWQVSTNGGSTWSNLASKTSSPLEFVATTSDNGNKYRARFSNACGDVFSDPATLTVDSNPLAATVSPDSQNVQYSDTIAHVTITATDDGPGSSLTASTQWKLNGGSFTSGLPTNLSLGLTSTGTNSRTWTLSGNVTVPPGKYFVRVTISDGSCSSFTDIVIVVEQENALADYIGSNYFSTQSATNGNFTATLMLTVRDSSDGNPGDIRKARVTFYKDPSFVPANVLGTANLTPVLVNSADSTVGTVSTSFSGTLTPSEISAGGKLIDVYYVVNNHYTKTDMEIICIAVPGAQNVTGGGYIVLSSTGSVGQYKGKPYSKMNYGFNMKNNKSGKNVMGNFNGIIRAFNDSLYQIKGTSINSLITWNSSMNARFETKANLTNVTHPLATYSLGGNLNLRVDLYDGGQNDSIAILLTKPDGTILFASNWDGIRNTMKKTGGGNIKIGGNILTKEAAEVIPEEYALFQNYPNPFNPSTQIQFDLPEPSNVTLRIFDLLGQQVTVLVTGERETGRYTETWDATGLASGMYFLRIEATSLISQRELVTVKKMLLMK